MTYITQYEVCALLFLVIVLIRFFTVRRFPSFQNKLFGVLLICSAGDILLDVAGSYTIMYAAELPPYVNYLINTAFYALQFVLLPLFLAYLVALAGLYYTWRRNILPLLMAPVAACLLVLVSNPFTKWIFYIDLSSGVGVYTRGPLFNLLYFNALFYLPLIFGMIVAFRRKLQHSQFVTMLWLCVALAATLCAQYVWPQYLLTGVTLAGTMLTMFFTLQNPEIMLDLNSGVFNYTAMMTFLNDQLIEKKPLWLVAVDVGGIRQINNSFGVEIGNKLFSQVGAFFNELEGGVRSFRMYGSRFLIVANSESVYNRVIFCVERRFERPWLAGQGYTTLSCTIRHFGQPDFFKSAEEVVSLLDNAYSDTDRDGWGTKKQVDTSLLYITQRRNDVENAIRDVLASGEGLILHYQPLYNMKEGRYEGVEALLRMRHPTLGEVSPGEFIPIAERSGLILRIDEYVIREVGAFLRRNGPELVPKVELNLSATEFSTGEYKRLYSIISESCVSPERVCFEVTETAATSHPAMLKEFMRSLIAAGFSFALDDFGTGFANISQVVSLPFSIVKLDRSMLIAAQSINAALFEGLIEIFSKIGLAVIIEGVETGEQVHRVQRLGAHVIQGYFFAKPMPEHILLEFLKKPPEMP
ncbi:MAG TPA: EAL domain-containing protein [Candidatus Acidoferrum sp.]|nr:EAL domain-containing protein [Candidatus Acidoferrum sp.]